MLDPWIIEEIRRREEERRRDGDRPRIDISIESPDQRDSKTPPAPAPTEEPERGVVIIDL